MENLSTYTTADNLAVLPENDPDAVEALAKVVDGLFGTECHFCR